MNLLIKYIKYKKMFVIGFIAKTVEVILELFLPVFMAVVMREGLKGNNYNEAYLMIGLIMAFAISGYFSTVFSHRLTAKVSQDFAKNLRQAIFYKVEDLAIEDTDAFSSSGLINRLNLDVSHLQNGLAMTMRVASRAPVLMIGSIVSLFIISPKIALVLAIGLPLIITVLIVIMYFSMRIFQLFQKQNDRLLENVKDNVEGVRMIRAFAQVEHEEKRFESRNKVLSEIMIKLGKVTSLSTPFATLAFNIVLVIMIYVGALDINIGSLDQEQLIQVINYTTQLTLSVIGVMNLVLLYTKMYSSTIRIKEILDKDKSVIDNGELIVKEGPMKIEFKNVDFSYESSSKNTLQKINLVINPNETIGVVGLTGSGKTTFIDLLMRFYDVNKGEILINDINIKEYKIESLRDKIAYASQKAALLYGDIRSNINMNKEYSDEEITEALKDAQAQFILRREKGIESEVLRQGMNYSGGQRQRIALARALVKDSSLLILDDVFSALDYVTDLKIRKRLDKRKNQQTKIYISQRLSSLVNTDKIIVIDGGKIIASGKHDELLNSCELYRSLYETQVAGGIQ
ncbi:MAG: ABC transporter ATP-binding protein [Acholeplasma sp.]|nr:ABC transporter ATP-binding protein [Acholeplasma sp.]